MMRSLFALALAAGAIALAGLDAADAAIKCKNGAQLVQGNLLTTPYCQDKLLADVARQYGMRVSFAEIRNNPNTKRNVCAFVGQDIRVKQTCIESNITGRRGF